MLPSIFALYKKLQQCNRRTRGGGAMKTLGGLTLCSLSWAKFPVFPYKGFMSRVNWRDVRGTLIFDIFPNAYEFLLEMIFLLFLSASTKCRTQDAGRRTQDGEKHI